MTLSLEAQEDESDLPIDSDPLQIEDSSPFDESDLPDISEDEADFDKASTISESADSRPTDSGDTKAEKSKDASDFDVKDLDVKRRTFIKHPNAEKGLTRITRNRDYIYKVPQSPQKYAVAVRFGNWEPDNLLSKDQTIAYSDIYQSSSFMVLVDWEYLLFKGFGKLGLHFGSGLMTNSGKGKLQKTRAEARETFTFFLFPNSLSAVYRLQFWDKQPLVPYAEAGLGYYTFGEIRDDQSAPKLGGSSVSFWSTGGALNLTALSRDTQLELDRDYGINAVWVTGEYRQIIGLQENFDMSSSLVTAGLLVEY